MAESPQPDLNMTVAALLNEWPQLIPVFIRHRMICVGCLMSSFDTLRDVTLVYGLAPEVFMKELVEALRFRTLHS